MKHRGGNFPTHEERDAVSNPRLQIAALLLIAIGIVVAIARVLIDLAAGTW